MLERGGSIDPSMRPDNEFVLYSIPAFDNGTPELVAGRDIGSPKKVVQSGDVLLSRIVPHIRRSWIVGSHATPEILASGEWIVFRSNKVHGPYLRHFLVCDTFHSRFMQTVAGVGGSLLRAKSNYVAEIPIPLPSLDEQRRIAAILDKADDLRRKRKKALELLEVLTQSAFLESFGREIFETPDKDLQTVADIATLQNGAYYPSEAYVDDKGSTEMVHMSDAFYGIVQRGKLKRVKCNEADVAKYDLRASDLLIARRSLTVEGAAKPCLIPDHREPLIYESSFIRVRLDPSVVKAVYLYHYLSHPFVRRKHLNPFITQSTISGINQTNLGRVKVYIPPIAHQNKFESFVVDVSKVRAAMLNFDRLDRDLFASLEHRAFCGRL